MRLKDGRRLDGKKSDGTVFEVELTGKGNNLKKAADRLAAVEGGMRVLVVPQKDIRKAIKAVTNSRISMTVRNISGTKLYHVKVVTKGWLFPRKETEVEHESVTAGTAGRASARRR